jgi:hypothetical protein
MDNNAELHHSKSDEVFFVIINDRWPKLKRVSSDAKEAAQYIHCLFIRGQTRMGRRRSVWKIPTDQDIYHFDGNKLICYSENASMVVCYLTIYQ